MNSRVQRILKDILKGDVLFHIPMGRYTTFRVGGAAEAFCRVRDRQTLMALISFLHREGIYYLIVGRGSNLLVRDEGIEGVVIQLEGQLAGIRSDMFFSKEEENDSNRLVYAGAGASISGLLAFCRSTGLAGLEFLAGIPGTVGGAVFMNAGAFGEEISSRIVSITFLEKDGSSFQERERSELQFSYRQLELEGWSVLTGATFILEKGDKKDIYEKIGSHLRMRQKTQPTSERSAGSVFKNPPGLFAARLIEEAGLKGKKIGGAMVSLKHANFIVNTGEATAGDILDLIDLCKDRVKALTGVDLELEIKIVP